MLTGGNGGYDGNSNYYLYTGQNYWLMSPSNFNQYNAIGFYVTSIGTLNRYFGYLSYGVRPSIVLAKGTRYSSGDGSFTNPYVIEEDE